MKYPYFPIDENAILLFHIYRHKLLFLGEGNIRDERIANDLFDALKDLCQVDWHDGQMDEVKVSNESDARVLAEYKELILEAANKAGDITLCEDEDWRYDQVYGTGNAFMVLDTDPDAFLTNANGREMITNRDWESGEGVVNFDEEYDTYYTTRANELTEAEARAVLKDANLLFAPETPTELDAVRMALLSGHKDLVVELAEKTMARDTNDNGWVVRINWVEAFPELADDLEEPEKPEEDDDDEDR